MLAPSRKIYVSGEIEIDPARVLIRCAGEERSLRPKTFRLLLYLLEHRERLVPKDELIQQLWPDTAVSDGAIAQCVADIRRALGEDSRQPRFIRTAPRIGYQFIGPIEEEPSQMVIIEEITESRLEYTEEIEEDEPAALLSGPRRPRWRKVAVICGFPAVAAIVGLGVWSLRSPGPIPAPEPGARTAIFEFENRSGNPELDWLRIGLADMVATSLSASPRLSLITPGQLQRSLQRPPKGSVDRNGALAAARQAGASAVVLGAFGSLGGSIRLDTQIYDVATGRLLGGESLTVENPSRLLAQLDPLAAKLATRLGAPFGAQTHLSEVMTNNLEAYRLYSLGLGRTRALRLREAIDLYEQAIQLDPAFAMAYARIGYTYSVAWASPPKGKPYLEKAYALSDRLTPRDRLFIRAWYAMASQDYVGAERAYREILVSFPAEGEVYLSLTSLMVADRRSEEARQIALRGLTIDPDMPELHNMLATAYLDLGQPERGIESARRYVALSGEPNAYDTLGSMYQQAGRYPEARDAYLEALHRKPDFEIAIIHLGNLYFQLGRYRDALDQFEEYIRRAPAAGERVRGHRSVAWLHWRKGDWRTADREAAFGVEQGSFPSTEALLLAADRGTLKMTEDLRRQIFAPLPSAARGGRENRRWRYFLAGHIALRDHKPEEALGDFRDALREPAMYWALDDLETCLADALLELGRLDEAMVEYRRILAVNPNHPMGRYRLGLALERKGMNREARVEFEHFLIVWRDADPDVPELLDARRR